MQNDLNENRSAEDLLDALYTVVDARDADALGAFLAQDVRFRLGSMDAIDGRADVLEANRVFFSSINGMSHQIDEILQMPEGCGCTGWVSYERLDGSGCSIPFATVLGLRDGLIADYRVYVDVSSL